MEVTSLTLVIKQNRNSAFIVKEKKFNAAWNFTSNQKDQFPSLGPLSRNIYDCGPPS